MNDTIQNVNRTLENVLTALNLLVVQGLQNCNIVAGCGNDIRSCINMLASIPDAGERKGNDHEQMDRQTD